MLSQWSFGRGGICRTITSFILKGKEKNICKLKKALHGLRQTPKAYNKIMALIY